MLQFTVPSSPPFSALYAPIATGSGSKVSLPFNPYWVAFTRPSPAVRCPRATGRKGPSGSLDFRHQHRVLVGSRPRHESLLACWAGSGWLNTTQPKPASGVSISQPTARKCILCQEYRLDTLQRQVLPSFHLLQRVKPSRQALLYHVSNYIPRQRR